MYVLLCNVCMYKYAREHVEYVYICDFKDNPQGFVHAAADLCGWSARISGKVPLLLPQVGRRYFVIGSGAPPGAPC